MNPRRPGAQLEETQCKSIGHGKSRRQLTVTICSRIPTDEVDGNIDELEMSPPPFKPDPEVSKLLSPSKAWCAC